MKPLLPLFVFLAFAASAFAIVDTPLQIRPGDRIGILRMPERYMNGSDGAVVANLRNYLGEELRRAGFEAYDAKVTYDDLRRNSESNADYYVEIVAVDGDAASEVGIGIGGDRVGVNLSLVISRVAAAVRVFDGHTLELLHKYDLHHSNRAVMPTDIALGGRHAFLILAVPFVQYAQIRSAAHDVARQAAKLISDDHN
jgi:hypothetical protein